MSILKRLLLAYFVVVLSEALAYPIDTIRKRLMMQSSVPDSQKTSKGIFEYTKKILEKEGVASLYKGILSNPFRIIKLAPSITLVLYDELSAYFV